MLLLDFVEDHAFLLLFEAHILVVGDDRRYSSARKREEKDAQNHQQNTNQALSRIDTADVAVSNGGDRCHSEVNSSYVKLESLLFVSTAYYPVLCFVVVQFLVVRELCGENPKARHKVTEHDKNHEEEDKAFKPLSNFEHVVEPIHNFSLLLDDLNQPDQAGNLNELVKLAHPSNSNQRVGRAFAP